MKILAVSQYYWPEHFQVTEECEELARRGHSVTVLTGLPNYPSGRIPEEYRRGRNREQIRNGVRIARAPLIERGRNPLQLALNYHSFAFNASRAIRRLSPDFDVLYVPEVSPVTMIEPAAAYKRMHGMPLLVYCCDLWPESLKNLLGNRLDSIVRFYGGISKRLYESADLLAIQSPAFSEYLAQVHGIQEDRMVFLPQFAEDSYLEEDFDSVHEGVNFLVMGNMGRAQDIPVILRAASLVPAEFDFSIHFVGEGSFYGHAKRMADDLGLSERVVFHGRHPYERMGDFYRIADACVIALNGDTWIGSTIPSRLQGYMAAGKPILAAANGGIPAILDDSKCGRCVPAGDSESLAALIEDFLANRSGYAKCGLNGRRYFSDNFTKKRHMDKLEAMLFGLVERK